MSKVDFGFDFNDDRSVLGLTITKDGKPMIRLPFTPTQLSQFILALGKFRAAMPERPAAKPPHGTADITPAATVTIERTPREVGSIISIGHPGFGLLHFALSRDQAAALHHRLSEHLQQNSKSPSTKP